MKKTIDIGNATDVGLVRSSNQDYFGAYAGKFGHLVVVCDGMGGHEGGEEASRIAVQAIKEHFEHLGEQYNPTVELTQAISSAHDHIVQQAQQDKSKEGMGTTAVVLLVKNEEAYTAHVGDSRIYLYRGGQVHQLTKDHSLVQQMVDAKMIAPEEARDHPKKNVIVKALGAGQRNYQPDVSAPISLFRHDKFMLCTDGLTAYLSPDEMGQAMGKNTPQHACSVLVKTAKERGGEDNITVQVVEILQGKRLPPEVSGRVKRRVRWLLMAAATLLFLLIAYMLLDMTVMHGKWPWNSPPSVPEKTTPAKPASPDSANHESDLPRTGQGRTTEPLPWQESGAAAVRPS